GVIPRRRCQHANSVEQRTFMLIGYARVSTFDQNPALQRDALTEAGCDRIFTEPLSGAVAGRPQLADAMNYARSGDSASSARAAKIPNTGLPAAVVVSI